MPCASIHRTAAMGWARMAAFTCSVCRTDYDEGAWVGLTLIERIEPIDVRRFVSIWPEELCVEVRRCSRCGQTMGRRTVRL